jgi:hypothetical protein
MEKKEGLHYARKVITGQFIPYHHNASMNTEEHTKQNATLSLKQMEAEHLTVNDYITMTQIKLKFLKKVLKKRNKNGQLCCNNFHYIESLTSYSIRCPKMIKILFNNFK